MALIKCQECGKEFSDKASACPNCACPLEKKTKKVIIERTKGGIGSKAPLIYIDDMIIGRLPLGEKLEADIPIGKHKLIMEYYVDESVGFRTGALATRKSVDNFTIDEDTDFIKIDISKFLDVKISNGNNCVCHTDNTTLENNVKKYDEEQKEEKIKSSANENLTTLGKVWLIFSMAVYGLSAIKFLLAPILKTYVIFNFNVIPQIIACVSCYLLYKTLHKKYFYILVVANIVLGIMPLFMGSMLSILVSNFVGAIVNILLTYLSVRNKLK